MHVLESPPSFWEFKVNFGGSELASVCGRSLMTIQEIAEIKATLHRAIIKLL